MTAGNRDERVGLIKGFILRQIGVADGNVVQEDTPLLDSGLVDSLLIVTLIAFIEEEFELAIPEEELTEEDLASVGAIADFVGRLQGRQDDAVEGNLARP